MLYFVSINQKSIILKGRHFWCRTVKCITRTLNSGTRTIRKELRSFFSACRLQEMWDSTVNGDSFTSSRSIDWRYFICHLCIHRKNLTRHPFSSPCDCNLPVCSGTRQRKCISTPESNTNVRINEASCQQRQQGRSRNDDSQSYRVSCKTSGCSIPKHQTRI